MGGNWLMGSAPAHCLAAGVTLMAQAASATSPGPVWGPSNMPRLGLGTPVPRDHLLSS